MEELEMELNELSASVSPLSPDAFGRMEMAMGLERAIAERDASDDSDEGFYRKAEVNANIALSLLRTDRENELLGHGDIERPTLSLPDALPDASAQIDEEVSSIEAPKSAIMADAKGEEEGRWRTEFIAASNDRRRTEAAGEGTSTGDPPSVPVSKPGAHCVGGVTIGDYDEADDVSRGFFDLRAYNCSTIVDRRPVQDRTDSRAGNHHGKSHGSGAPPKHSLEVCDEIRTAVLCNVELLHRIFGFVFGLEQISSDLRAGGPLAGVGEMADSTLQMKNITTGVRLAAVCSLWRKASHGVPELWQDVDLAHCEATFALKHRRRSANGEHPFAERLDAHMPTENQGDWREDARGGADGTRQNSVPPSFNAIIHAMGGVRSGTEGAPVTGPGANHGGTDDEWRKMFFEVRASVRSSKRTEEMAHNGKHPSDVSLIAIVLCGFSFHFDPKENTINLQDTKRIWRKSVGAEYCYTEPCDAEFPSQRGLPRTFLGPRAEMLRLQAQCVSSSTTFIMDYGHRNRARLRPRY